jgi:hypothetical protein
MRQKDFEKMLREHIAAAEEPVSEIVRKYVSLGYVDYAREEEKNDIAHAHYLQAKHNISITDSKYAISQAGLVYFCSLLKKTKKTY